MKQIVLGPMRSDVPGVSVRTCVSVSVLRMFTLFGGEQLLRVIYTAPGGVSKPFRNGPVVQGPFAPTAPAEPSSLLPGRVPIVDVEAGERVQMDSFIWEVRDFRKLSYPELILISTDAPPLETSTEPSLVEPASSQLSSDLMKRLAGLNA